MKNTKGFFFLLSLFIGTSAFCQNNYWQQYLRYNIDAQLNDKEKSVTGFETIVYKNNSPETLHYIWFHIYPNAYRDQTTALFHQIKNDPQRKEKLERTTPGYITNLAFTVNGTKASTEPHPNAQYIDIIKVVLPQPLKHADSVTIATPFKVQLPSYFSRSGYADGEFMVCQWYPKPAVFDKDGWHEMPYLDMGEFYSEYASYKVNITLPSQYVVGATGVLQTTSEAQAYKKIGAFNTAHSTEGKPQLYSSIAASGNKTLSYFADSVPDFAWFADKGFVIEYDTLKLESGKVIDAFTYYHNHSNTPWTNSIEYVKDGARHYSKWIGEYSYPIVQAVEGPKNNSSGGMEYPTITLITSPDAKPQTLDAVIAHEVGHNWFMGMLGTNERTHPWMDEGMNTYYQFRYEAEKYRANSVFGDRMPLTVKQLPEAEFQSALYNAMLNLPIQPALETPSANYANSEDYGLTSYVKAAEWMHLLEASVGREKVDSAFQHYFNTWKFKHPQPADMKAAFEQAIGGSLNQFFSLLNKEGKLVE
ncbi:MAG: M1 family metallopeptidase [Bacteroidota bacterium]|nr:M1 family metallopeptidase [Bacteroidota bacterium]